jgi:adenylate kinase
MNARAREIGVSTVTLRKWRDERGVDVFDDEAVKRHIARSRNHSFKIAARFKASLSR